MAEAWTVVVEELDAVAASLPGYVGEVNALNVVGRNIDILAAVLDQGMIADYASGLKEALLAMIQDQANTVEHLNGAIELTAAKYRNGDYSASEAFGAM